MSYQPPYTITTNIVQQISDISELIADIKYIENTHNTLKLRKKNKIRSITGTLQIEGNSFDESKVTQIINNTKVLGTLREIEEVKGAIKAYDRIGKYDYKKQKDLLLSHKYLMENLLDNAGEYRNNNVGVGSEDGVAHIAPPPNQVPKLMNDLFEWLENSDEHYLIKSSVFHYEFEFIHPFSDGNGRVGRLWQSVILRSYKEFFEYIPIESIVREYQEEYYKALEDSGSSGESTPFIEFILDIIYKALVEYIKESKKSNQKSSLKSDQKILALIKEESKITIKELCDQMKMSESGVKKVIKKLKDENKLQRVGSLKGGSWKVIE